MISPTPKQLFDEYRRQFKSDAALADRSLREALRKVLAERLQLAPLSLEDVHVAADFALYFGEDRRGLIEVLTRYLAQALSTEEEAWARWKLVDTLALLERQDECVATQRQFLSWARGVLAPSQLLWVMYDSTQALCWVETGVAEEWIQVFHEIMAHVPATPDNRRGRLIYLETASVVLGKLGKHSEVPALAQMAQELSEEDASWERALEARLTSFQMTISACHATQQGEELQRMVRTATDLLERQWDNRTDMSPAQKQRLFVMYHNLGGTLYLVREYELAVPLFRRAVELGSFVEHTYLWLAASLWATTANRPEVLALLRQGAHRVVGDAGSSSLGYNRWRQLPEFQNVVDDPDFRDVLNS